MKRSYRKPPIIEALCEFQFEPSQPWDGTFLGPIYDKVQSVFPMKRPVDTLQVQVGLSGQEAPAPSVVSVPGSMLFMREDEKVLMRVGPDVFSVHHLQPYSDWETLRGYIERALDAYRQVARPSGVRRLGCAMSTGWKSPARTLRSRIICSRCPLYPRSCHNNLAGGCNG